MTGDPLAFTEFSEGSNESVVFGDGARSNVLGKETLDVPGFPNLKDVMLVEGLKTNLISISQLCDEGMSVKFNKEKCMVIDQQQNKILEGRRSQDNCYMITSGRTCCVTISGTTDIWHQKLGHPSLRAMQKLMAADAIRGMPKFKVTDDGLCKACLTDKHIKQPHPKVKDINTTRCLELLHMDLMGPMQVESIGRRRYAFVCVDDFSRFTWVDFLRDKSEAFEAFSKLCLRIENEKELKVRRIRSNHGREFENINFTNFCDHKGIHHEFSAPKTPQQNGVVERKNRTLQEMVRTIMKAKELPHKFWGEAMNTSCHIINRVFLRPKTKTTPYELWKGKKPNLKYFHIFGCTCYVLKDMEQKKKLDDKGEEAIFLEYSNNSRAYRVFLKESQTIIESIIVRFNDDQSGTPNMDDEDDVQKDVHPEVSEEHNNEKGDISDPKEEHLDPKQPSKRIMNNHPTSAVIGGVSEGIKTRGGERVDYLRMVAFVCYVSKLEQKNVTEALLDEIWIEAMQLELLEFERHGVCMLVPKPDGVNIIGTK